MLTHVPFGGTGEIHSPLGEVFFYKVFEAGLNVFSIFICCSFNFA